MPSTILALIQKFARKNNLEVPSVVFASTDAGVLQLRECLDDAGRHIHRKSNWQITLRRASWISIAGEDQGAINTLIGADLDYIVPDSFWDTTERKPIFGPVLDRDWQALKALVPSSPYYQYRVMGGKLLIRGPMVVNHTLSLIWKSRNWLEVSAGSGTYVEAISADTNVPFWDDELMLLGLKAYWKEIKSLPNDKDMLAFNMAVFDAASKDDVKPVIKMHGGEPQIKPGIWVPAGNWTV